MLGFKSDDVVSIEDYFKELTDPRSTVSRVHHLGDLIVICVLAVVASADGSNSIGVCAKANDIWLRGYLELPAGIPSRGTIRRLLATIRL